MNKSKENIVYITVAILTIALLYMLIFACIINKNEIGKLKKDIIILTNKEGKKWEYSCLD